MNGRLRPGARHPHPSLDVDALAARFGVAPEEVLCWRDAGLPALADGRIDPFAAVNWLSWGRLDRCPALARRWRRYLAFFGPFVAGESAPRRRRWRRTHRLALPVAVDRLEWWLPAAARTPVQDVLAAEPPRCGAVAAVARDGGWALDIVAPDEVPLAQGAETVERRPQRGLAAGSPEHAALLAAVEDVAASFTYVYRHHDAGEGIAPVGGLRGSCLDCARLLGRRVADAGRPWRLVAGIVADDELANPHFWIEVDTATGPQPLDATLPAIARMLGADWRAFARAYTGGLDARRIELAPLAVSGLPAGPTLDSLIGEAVATIDGGRLDAWECIDWVGGECEAEFAEPGPMSHVPGPTTGSDVR